jgi:phosphoribosyl-dephospho-CoA transferase
VGRAVTPAVHALLRIASPGVLTASGPAPAWLAGALARAPWVVVRRVPPQGPLLPVGVRGAHRAERFAAWLPVHAVQQVRTPVQLAVAHTWRGQARCACVPALGALDSVATVMRSLGLEAAWGPLGSVGFELASGAATATQASDLDLLLHAPRPLRRELACALYQRLAALPVRADLLLETPGGALALAEYVAGRAPFGLRTLSGPRLVQDPWRAAAAA